MKIPKNVAYELLKRNIEDPKIEKYLMDAASILAESKPKELIISYLEYFSSGKSYEIHSDEIASYLGISLPTVKKYIDAIREEDNNKLPWMKRINERNYIPDAERAEIVSHAFKSPGDDPEMETYGF